MAKILKLSGNFTASYERAELIEQIEAAQKEMAECRYGSEEYYEAKKRMDDAKKAHAATFSKRGDRE